MTTEKLDDLELKPLSDFFAADYFRIIPVDAVDIPCGLSELPVIFNVHYILSKEIKYNQTDLQQIYGYTRIIKKTAEINNSTTRGKGLIKKIYVNDSGDLSIIVFEMKDETKKLYSVKSSEVLDLLNNCRMPNRFV